VLAEVELGQVEHSQSSRSFRFLGIHELLGSEIERQALGEVTVETFLPSLRQAGLPKPLQPLDTVDFALHVPTIEPPTARLPGGSVTGALKGRSFDDPRREGSWDPGVGVVTSHARLPLLANQ
jgi:hypothetical protein